MVLVTPIMLGVLTVVLLMKLPAVRYLSSEMAATIGVGVTVFAYHFYELLGLQCLEQLVGLN